MAIFLDMDYTIVQFPQGEGELGTKRYKTEQGFFRNLKPYSNIWLVDKAIKETEKEVYVLSNSPHEQADEDKSFWLDSYVPSLPKQRRIFNNNSNSKFSQRKSLKRLTLASFAD